MPQAAKYQLAEMTGEPPRDRPPSILSTRVEGKVELHRRSGPGEPGGIVETITADDLARLSDRQRQLIETFEQSRDHRANTTPREHPH